MRRKTAIAGFSYFADMFFASFLSLRIISMVSGLLLILAGLSFILPSKVKIYCVTIIISAFVGLSVYGIYLNYDYDKVISYDNSVVEFSGKIIDHEYISSDLMALTVKGKINGKKNATITVFIADMEVNYYDKVSFKAKLSKIKDSVVFQSENYNKPRGIYMQGNITEDFLLTEDTSFNALRVIRNYSDYLFEKITTILPNEEGAFIGAMLCGDTSGITSESKTNLFRMGIGHIFSVSGSHLVIVGFMVNAILDMLKLSKKKKFIISEIVIIGFTIFAGMASSVVRAAIMMTIVNLSKQARRYNDSLTTTALCAILMTIITPYQIRNASFLLSLCGAFSLGVISPLVIKAIDYKYKMKSLVNSLISMCCVTIISLPICIMYFNELSIVSPIMNLIFVPLCSFALVLSVVIAFTGGISVIANPILIIAGIAVKPVLWIADIIGKQSFSFVPLGYNFLKFAICLVLVAVIILCIIKRNTLFSIRCTICGLIIIMASSVGYSLATRDDINIYVISYQNSSITVLNKDRRTVIIDSGGKSTEGCIRLLQSKGIINVDAIFIRDNYDSVKIIYENSLDFCNLYNSNIYEFEDLTTFNYYGAEVEIRKDGYIIKYANTTNVFKISSDFEAPDCNTIVDFTDSNNTFVQTNNTNTVFSKNKKLGGTAVITLNPNKTPTIRRLNYAFG